MGEHEAVVLLCLAAPGIGSFLRILVERLPIGEPLIFVRTRCSSCRQLVAVADLVPVLGWLRLRGRCRGCGVRGAVSAPRLELAALAIALWAIAAPMPVWPSAVLGWTLLALSLIDWRHFLLPDALTLPLLGAGLAMATLSDTLPDHLFGALAGAAALLLVASGFRRVSGRNGLGMGDVKLFAAGGAWVGWHGLPGVLLIASLLGLLYATVAGRGLRREGGFIPFGPFLAAGIWIGWIYGPIGL